MTRLRVLVVEDSLTIRRRFCEILSADPDLEVVADAEDGKRAIELCQQYRPDVITLDMMLPVMTGLAATEYIMAYVPTPILIVSASFNRGEVFRTYDALAAGAVDVLEKPRGDESDGEWERRFVSTIKLVSRIKVITHPRGRLAGVGNVQPTTPALAPSAGAYRVVAIGASTGGPGALVAVLRGMPAPSPIPVIVLLHIDEPFGAAFAEWLDGQTGHRVSYARSGELVSAIAGRVVMAPPGQHMSVQDGKVRLTAEPPRNSCRPSIDVLFESLAREYRGRAIGCLLTGMGRDGAAGLLAISQAGGCTIAQDEATSVVFGMPREAAKLGAAQRVLPLDEIGAAIGQAAVRSEK